MWITWKHQDSDFNGPLTLEQKVDLFYEQALGWQLHIADLVANGGVAFGENGDRQGKAVAAIRHSGFAVLQICLSYFETVGYYMGEASSSRAAFMKGAREVFPDLSAADRAVVDLFLDDLYSHVRCGLYHNVRTVRLGLGVLPEPLAVAYDSANRRVIVCPERFPKALIDHLDRWRNALLDPRNADLRHTFEAKFNQDSGAG
jgi:hypothetical protein